MIHLVFSTFAQLWREEKGQDLVEYTLMIAIVVGTALTIMPYNVVGTMLDTVEPATWRIIGAVATAVSLGGIIFHRKKNNAE